MRVTTGSQVQGLEKRRSAEAVFAALLAGVAMLLGGGGTPAPVPELLLQCFTALLVAALLVTSPRPVPWVSVDRRAWSIAILVLALPILQLIPLPPVLWQHMAGREIEVKALMLVGEADSWRTWSVSPRRTFAALLVLLPALAMMLQVANLGRGGRSLVLGIVAAIGLLSLVVGAGQLGGGEGGAFRFYPGDLLFINGFQANHNAAADVLLVTVVAVPAVLREYLRVRPRTRLRQLHCLAIVGGIDLLLAVGVVLTASRAGMALLPVAGAGAVAIAMPWIRSLPRPSPRVIAGGVIALALAAFAVLRTGAIGRVLARLDFSGESRPDLWSDTLYAAWQHFPWGGGLGTFVPLFVAAERLEQVDEAVTNRAHNDYLELLLEGGLFGVLALLGVTAIIVGLIWAGRRNPAAGSRAHYLFAITTLGLIALHSIVDYPLRSMSLAFVAAICVGLLMPVRGDREAEERHA